jgi:Zn-dependent oligopeptidase
MYLALNSRDGERNTALLEEALLLRAKEATLLGFKSYAAFAATNTMAGDSETVSGFLSSLIEGIRAHRDEELARLAAAKVADTHDSRDLAPWDLAYYQHTIAKASAPEEVPDVSAFFPATRVVPGILRMCEKLLDLEIRLVADADGWAPGIELYEVRDRSNGDLMGSFYLDLYARPGKFTQSAVSTAGVARQEGHSYLTPVAVLHTNFPPPTSDRPALLGMGDLRRLFHEFGHLMHIVLTTVRYGGQSGAATLSDFREVPSLLFEHFATDQQVLVAISGHVLDPARKLPGDFIARLQKQRSESTGVSLAHKVYVAALDQALHSGSDLGVDATDRRVYAEIVGLAAADQAHFSATVPHLMLKGGVYFSYLWSEVIADDLFTRFAEAGGADPGVGRQYRDLVLARGASVAPDQLLRDFLGRKSNPDAFLRKLGLH